MSFTHLHVHTVYSQYDGLARIEDLFRKASALGQPGLAITDHGTMSGVPEFLKVANRYPDIKPVVGCEFYLTDGDLSELKHKRYHLILLAKNLVGYHNLLRLCSIAGTEGWYDNRPHIDHKALTEHHEGIMALSGCIGGEIPQAILEGDQKKARELTQWYKGLFGDDFYLEVSEHRSRKNYYKGNLHELQQRANTEIFKLAKKYGIKVVATNDVHMVEADDYKAHEVLLCSNTGKTMLDEDRFFYTGEEYMRSEEVMMDVFADHQEAVHNTADVLEKVERFEIRQQTQLPDFPLPTGISNADDYLRSIAYECLQRRGESTDLPNWGNRGEKERLDYELDVICGKGFANYFLILWGIVMSVKEAGHSVGLGRSSAPGSFLCYVLGITDVDPIATSLSFERFISTEKSTLPDVDLDFDSEGTQIAYEYLQSTFGSDHVARMCCFARRYHDRALRDAMKAFGIADRSIFNDNIDVVAARLEKTILSTDVHSSAVLLSRNPISEYAPVCISHNDENDKDDLLCLYDGYQTEDMGILKFDFLRLNALDVIREASKGIHIPDTFDDPEVYELFSRGETEGIFMFDSPGMKALLIWIKPDTLEELSQMYAMYRPNHMDDFFISRVNKEDMREGKLPHWTAFGDSYEYVADILDETFGLLIYQEQLMLIARKFGFSGNDAYLFRIAVLKGNQAVLKEMEKVFIAGGERLDIPYEDILRIWEGILKEGHDTYLKAHTVAYTATAYRLAWLKVHYVKQFAEASLKVAHLL